MVELKIIKRTGEFERLQVKAFYPEPGDTLESMLSAPEFQKEEDEAQRRAIEANKKRK